MTYGVKLINGYEEETLGGDILYEKLRGTSISQTSRPITSNINSFNRTSPGIGEYGSSRDQSFRGVGGLGFLANIPASQALNLNPHYVATAFEKQTGGNQFWDHPIPLTSNYEDMIFIKPGTLGVYYGMQWAANISSFTNGISAMYMNTSFTQQFDYVIATTTPDQGAGSYGMKLYDAAGNKEFDSRNKMFPIKDSFLVTKAQFTNILVTGTPLDLTLRQAIPDAFVSIPLWANYRWSRANNTAQAAAGSETVLLTQTSSTNLRLSRNLIGNKNYSEAGDFFKYSHDAFIIVGG